MPVPRYYLCDGLTLKKSTLGEADLIVTLFTREHGKLRAVAKGARRSTNKLVGHLEPLTLGRFSMSNGKSLDYINQVQITETFAAIKSDLGAVSKALYVAELVDGFGAEANPNPALFNLAVETLQAIGQVPESEWPLRFFEIHLLAVSGLMPELYQCVECNQALSPGEHRFSPAVGGTLCSVCQPENAHVRPLSLRALKVLRLIHRGPMAAVLSLKADDKLTDELKSLIGGAVSYWLEREIRSKSFLEQLHRESRSQVYS
jgi:DNA repair protein RecO (recombination protein O)